MKEKQGTISTRVGKKYKSYSIEDKIKAVSMSEAGISSTAISRELGIDSSLIRCWSRKYRKDGVDGLRPVSNRKTTYSRNVNYMGENKERPAFCLSLSSSTAETDFVTRMRGQTIRPVSD